MRQVLITGSRGMLGSALLECVPADCAVTGVDLEDGDLSVPDVAAPLLARYRPDVVLHCAAWTDVDGCTREPERAMRHNGQATAHLAAACTAQGARLLYVSTDYVFPGDAGRAYQETDEPRPLNPYGESKLAGERAVATVPNHTIIRTQWLYGPRGKNFVATIVKAARLRGALRVVADEFGSPTYTPDLARALWQLAGMTVNGLVHVTNTGVCSWYDLACEAVRLAGVAATIDPISSTEWPSPTRRPGYSPLANTRWEALGLPPRRPWQEALAEYVSRYLNDEEEGKR